MKIHKEQITLNINDIKEYENNPRINNMAVDDVAESIKQCGYINPIIVDENNVILAGHTRKKGLEKLGKDKIQVLKVTGLTEEQKKKYRILDNKTAEKSEWDFDKLQQELEELDFEDYDFGFEINNQSEENNPYTAKVDIPHYEITNEEITLNDCYDTVRAKVLIDEIKASSISEDEKKFLIAAAKRHICFNYKNIAEYYAKASKEMQQLMENSALVIIDYKKAIANGYAKLYNELTVLRENAE